MGVLLAALAMGLASRRI
ncbi:MAG: hypothetical protein ACOX57_12215 [Limnochordia bacterium]